VLCARLRRAFDTEQRTEPLVIGLFGAWGTGKTLWLQHISNQFPRPEHPPPTTTPTTLAITFNAWRYENEPHLIVPLLKTAERELLRLPEPRWKPLAHTLGYAALAIGSGLKGELNVPMIGKLSLDLNKIWQTDQKLQRRRHKPSLSEQAFPELASIYFDFRSTISQIVGPDADPRLNLLFLIDDLDRCLPEKAVQLLESIKLFLDVPGCGFVLALDEEVIERGIAHRYRDYHPAPNTSAHHTPPITGHEYLEKIVHLPIRIPTPRETEVIDFMQQHYHDLFQLPRQTNHETNWNQPLLNLFCNAIPPVPRKLHRAAELLQTKLAITAEHGWTNPDRLTLARLVCLELFAPDVYRFARRHAPTRLLPILHTWAALCQHTPDIRHPDIQQWLTDREHQGEQDDGIRYDLEHQLKPLYTRLLAAATQRNGFEPLRLADPQYPSNHPNILDYFDLKPSPEETVPEYEYRATAPKNAERFYSLLFSTNTELQRDAITNEADHLRNQILDTSSNTTLLQHAAQQPEIVTVSWLARLTPYLTPETLNQLVRQTNLLRRLQAARQTGSKPAVATQQLRRLLELLARQHNPAWRPGTHIVPLADLNPDSDLNLQDLPLQGAWLRGLDFTGLRGTPDLTGAHLLDTQGLTQPQQLPDHPTPLLPITGHASSVLRVIQLTDGTLVSASDDHTLRRWSTEGDLLAKFVGHTDSVHQVIQLADGTLFSASTDHTLRRWSLQGDPLSKFVGHTGSVHQVIQLADNTLVSASADRTLRRWSIEGKELLQFTGHTDWVNQVIQLTDGTLVSAASDCTLLRWSLKGEQLARFDGHSGSVNQAVQLADGTLISVSDDQTLRRWSLQGEQLARFDGHSGRVNQVIQLADDSLVSAADDHTLHRWSLEGDELAQFNGHTDWVRQVIQLTDGTLISAADDHTLRRWSLEGDELARFSGHTDWVCQVIQLADGTLISIADDHTLRHWSFEGDELARFAKHTNWVHQVTQLTDGTLISASADHTLRRWSVTGKPLADFIGHTDRVNQVTQLTDGTLVSASDDHTLRHWSLAGDPLARFAGHTERVNRVIQLTDGTLISAADDHTLRHWSLAGDPLAKFTGHTGPVRQLIQLADGTIVSASTNHTLRRWSTEGKLLAEFTGHTDTVLQMAQLADGTIISAADDHTLRRWSTEGKLLAELTGHTGSVLQMTQLADDTIVSASTDRTLRRWSTEGKLLAEFTGHTDAVLQMTQLTDDTLVSASADRTLRRWSLEGSELARFTGHTGPVRQVIQLADGTFASAADDGTLRFWDLETNSCTAYWQTLPHGYRMIADQEGIHLHSAMPIRTTEWQGKRVPNDPILARYAGFLVDGKRVDAWRFPQALHNLTPDTTGKYHHLTLLWPTDHDPTAMLGQIIPH
jgi:WD40 repeat protein